MWSLPLHNQEVFVSHRNARLTVHGRRLLVDRVRRQHMPVAHVAKAMGISRQCAHRWLARFDADGDAGLVDRSSRPHTMPTRTSADVEELICQARQRHRRGQDWLGPELGVAPRTVSRVLRRHDMPRLCTLDPITGEIIRSSKSTAVRYERDRPGELVHMDVKKIGRIPDGGGWRAHGRAATSPIKDRTGGVGYDYVHSVVDDHSRLAYSVICDDQRAPRSLPFRSGDRVLQRSWRHHRTVDDRQRLVIPPQQRPTRPAHRPRHHPQVHPPHCPWQNGKVERFNRTLQTEWAYRQVFTSNDERRAALPHFLDDYNHRRRHSAFAGHPPISRLSTT